MNMLMGTNLQNMLNRHDYAVIISAELENVQLAVNEINTAHLERDLINTGLHCMPAIGCYKGVKEASFVVLCNNLHDVMRIECLGMQKYKQDSVLIIDTLTSVVMLKYADECLAIGRNLVQVENTEGLEAYTIINDEIWMVI